MTCVLLLYWSTFHSQRIANIIFPFALLSHPCCREWSTDFFPCLSHLTKTTPPLHLLAGVWFGVEAMASERGNGVTPAGRDPKNHWTLGLKFGKGDSKRRGHTGFTGAETRTPLPCRACWLSLATCQSCGSSKQECQVSREDLLLCIISPSSGRGTSSQPL